MPKSFFEKYAWHIVAIILIMIIAFVVYAYISKTTPEEMAGQGIQNIFNITNNTPNQQQEPITQRSDLREIAAPYLAASDAERVCEFVGATWHYTTDWVGCEGIGTLDCTQPILQAARTQCIGTGANWVCGLNNLYCKY